MILSFIFCIKFQAQILNHYDKKNWAVKPQDSKLLYDRAKAELNLWVRQNE